MKVFKHPPLTSRGRRAGALFIATAIAFVASGLASQQAWAGTLVTSSFDAGLDGWTSNTPSQVTWQSTGGAPGGFLRFIDASADSTYVYAPARYLGDYLTKGVTSIDFDDDIFAETRVESVSPYEIDLSGPGGSATWLGATPSLSNLPTGWTPVSAAVSAAAPPSGWTVTSGTWTALLANVAQVDIPIEFVTNDQNEPWTDIEGIDNVVVTEAVPEPAAWALMLAGFGAVGAAMRAPRRKRAAA